jgi:hypothetical protein
MIFGLALALGCASTAEQKPAAEIPSKMLPHGGKTQSRAKGLGDVAPFVK